MHEYAPLIDDLRAAIARRCAAESDLACRFPPGDDQTQADLQRQIRELSQRREEELERLQAALTSRREESEAAYRTQVSAVDFAHRQALKEIERRHNEELRELEDKYHSSTWVTTSVLADDSEESPKRKFDRYKSALVKSREDQSSVWTQLQSAFQNVVDQSGWEGAPPLEPTDPPADRDAAQERFQQVVEAAEQERLRLDQQWLTRLFIGLRPLWLFAGLTCTFFLPLWLLVPPSLLRDGLGRFTPEWGAITAGAACFLAMLLELVLYALAGMRRSEIIRRLQQFVAEAGWVHQRWLAMARDELQQRTREFESRQRDIVKQREETLARFHAAHAERREQIESRRDEAQRIEERREHEQRTEIERQFAEQQRVLQEDERRQLADASQAFEREHSRLQRELDDYSQVRQRNFAQVWQALRTEWAQAWDRFHSAVQAEADSPVAQHPAWDDLLDGGWRPPRSIPQGVPFGQYAIDLLEIDQAQSANPQLALPVTDLSLPAVLPFPNASSLLLEFRGTEARSEAIALQQTLLLRLLTLLPPGTLRLTILDPVGLGESFAGLMHLADYDEKLVTSRIWTEAGQIEARLADLTEHMENVFQKYLRNEFASIEEYNVHAGEVAEPYHFLVISDFPAKFSDVAARRLTSIITSGPRCGVYTLLSADLAHPLPNNFRLEDLRDQMRTLAWSGGAFRSPGPSGVSWPLVIDRPPPPETFTQLVRQIGRESKDARRVEVSFSRIAPRADAWWSEDSRREIDVPLGRAGATRLQHLRLGIGTSQHMLVAGKTGSGKSTFLHALITNLALHYSPQEVRFCLIDFKKGVEFKDYAACGLPHADVVAIESDREFGVSVLQRLDALLQERGELFRRHGVQDIAGFRNANPEHPLPRILLVVDEFQEFFIEDDKLSQTASLLLDRLVRQGRAFGMHVILGSQTLGGAYSLARSTLGQVAVRVALQCSEADAHLILSESNTAARLLSRPGEAIYNDANGLLEGNHPFQIAWLDDVERESLLRRLGELSCQRGYRTPPAIVFEGNIPSDPARNAELVALVGRRLGGVATQSAGEPAGPASPIVAPTIWLGESVDIGPPTAVTFHRQAGSHLLIVGADSEAAYGLLATAALTVAAQSADRPEVSPPLWIFDGSPSGSAESDWWKELCQLLPGAVRHITPRQASEALRELVDECAQRSSDPDAVQPSRFIIVYNISKFRDLRKSEDDYGFGGFGSQTAEKPADPGKQFAELIADGPPLGMHTLIWCDSAGNLDRWFSRQTLKELELRVAFQMNAADSSNLIDSPLASRLGVHRALLYREETGGTEKFRPYGSPNTWLRNLCSPDQTESGLAILPEVTATAREECQPSTSLQGTRDHQASPSDEPASKPKAPAGPKDPAAATPPVTPPETTGKPAESDDDLEIATDLDAFTIT